MEKVSSFKKKFQAYALYIEEYEGFIFKRSAINGKEV